MPRPNLSPAAVAAIAVQSVPDVPTEHEVEVPPYVGVAVNRIRECLTGSWDVIEANAQSSPDGKVTVGVRVTFDVLPDSLMPVKVAAGIQPRRVVLGLYEVESGEAD